MKGIVRQAHIADNPLGATTVMRVTGTHAELIQNDDQQRRAVNPHEGGEPPDFGTFRVHGQNQQRLPIRRPGVDHASRRHNSGSLAASRLEGNPRRAEEDLVTVPLDMVESRKRLPTLWFVQRLAQEVENEHLGGSAAPYEPG